MNALATRWQETLTYCIVGDCTHQIHGHSSDKVARGTRAHTKKAEQSGDRHVIAMHMCGHLHALIEATTHIAVCVWNACAGATRWQATLTTNCIVGNCTHHMHGHSSKTKWHEAHEHTQRRLNEAGIAMSSPCMCEHLHALIEATVAVCVGGECAGDKMAGDTHALYGW